MKEDFENLKSLAERGIAQAQYKLGLMYSSGTQVPQDIIIAHKWFNLAALSGDDKALEERKNLAVVMSEKELSEAQKAAREWRKNHPQKAQNLPINVEDDEVDLPVA